MNGKGLCLGLCALTLGFANAEGVRRPMALMVMIDGMRADAIESADMPNLTALRAGAWQEGYAAAWSVTGQAEPAAAPNSAPNHASIATGVLAAKHGVTANDEISHGNFAQYPTWLKRVVDAKSGATALFVYAWSEDAALGPAEGVTFLGQTDAENASSLMERLAATDAPDATLYFIDCADSSGHNGGFYPYSSAYRSALATADAYLGNCLNAIANRPTFAEEDWLILVTADHGGYAKEHGQTSGRQAHTVPIVISGRAVTPGRIPGSPYNFDVTASALAHFGINPAAIGLDAQRIDNTAVTDTARPLSDGLAVYLPFTDSETENAVAGSSVTAEANGSATLIGDGFVGNALTLANGGYLRLPGTENLTYEGGDKSFTAIIWVKMVDQPGDDPVLFGNENWASGRNPGMLLCAARAEAASTRGVVMNAGSGSSRLLIGTFDYEGTYENPTLWTFYAVTRSDEGVFTTYQGRNDGTLNWASGTFDDFVFKNGFPFCIGQDGTGKYDYLFMGDVDDFALWTRSLSHEEIRRIYEYGRAGMELGELLTMETHDAPTMTIASSSSDAITLAFGGRRTRNLQLFVAYGEEDGADDKYAWETFESLAEITPETDSYVYTLPEALKDGQTPFRFFLLQTTDLPYTQEVQYVQSAGNSFIDTRIAPRRDMTATFNVQLTEQNGTWDWLFGAFGGDNKKANFGAARFWETREAKGWWHLEVSGSNDTPFEFPLFTLIHVSFSPDRFIMDGNRHDTGLTTSAFIEGGWTINLFRNLKKGAPYDQTMKGWFETFTLATPRHTVRDFQPVKDEDGIAGMFDAVTGQFFPSGGEFLMAGPVLDASRRGWVRSRSETFTACTASPVTATWTGQGTDPANLDDPANWLCVDAFNQIMPNALPMRETAIIITGVTSFTVPADAMPSCKSITIDNAILKGDADWRGLDFAKLTDGSAVNLQGHSLILTGMNGSSTATFSVTDTSADETHPGELHLEVAEEAEFVNRTFAFGGNLRLVKDGPGAYTAMNAGQTYTGGTRVTEGCVKLGITCVFAPFGALGSPIEVAAGAALDTWSRFCYSYPVILAGGTHMNTRNPAVTSDMNSLVRDITLTADSEILFDTQTAMSQDRIVEGGAVWDLNGYTLTVTFQGGDPDFWFGDYEAKDGNRKLILKNGTVKTQGEGWWHDIITDGTEGGSYDFSTILRHYGISTVSNLTLRSENPDVRGNGIYRVYGTFTPLSPFGFDVQMLDGSTIDLSTKTGTWSNLFGNRDNICSVTFADQATVTVFLGDRPDISELSKNGTYVLTWTEETAPAANVVFKTDEGLRKRGFEFLRETDGLLLVNHGGTVVIVQ